MCQPCWSAGRCLRAVIITYLLTYLQLLEYVYIYQPRPKYQHTNERPVQRRHDCDGRPVQLDPPGVIQVNQ
jgi:hypothetical protein